jgi:hypothetical protein
VISAIHAANPDLFTELSPEIGEECLAPILGEPQP